HQISFDANLNRLAFAESSSGNAEVIGKHGRLIERQRFWPGDGKPQVMRAVRAGELIEEQGLTASYLPVQIPERTCSVRAGKARSGRCQRLPLAQIRR